MNRHVLSTRWNLSERVGGACAALAVAALFVPGSGQARTSPVACGATITTDIKLAYDLTNCPGNGLVIGADGITVDLNGHTIAAAPAVTDLARLAGVCERRPQRPLELVCRRGIDNEAGHSGVTIRGGTVRGFDVGVGVAGASNNRITGLAVGNSDFGVIVEDSATSRIDHNSVRDGVHDISMFDSRDGRIDHNSATGAHGYAIPVFGSSHIRIMDNVLDGNDHGIALDHSDHNEITSNRISHSGGSSLDFGGRENRDNRVEHNVLTDNGDGIVGGGVRNVISDNSVTGTGFFGFPDASGFGLILDGGHDDLVQRNRVTGGRGPAIYLTQLESPDAPDHTVLSGNVANSRLSDGILVDAGAIATLLERNTANQNGDDGIHVDASGTTVTANTANENHDLGIEAVLGVIDGGGNRATGNGNALQCTNLACS